MEANENAFYGGGWGGRGGWGRGGWGGPRRWGWGGPGPWGYGGYRRYFRRAYCCPLLLVMMMASVTGMLLGTFSLARLVRRPAR